MYLRNTGYYQTVREIQVTPSGTVVLRVLDGPDALLTILILFLRTEVVVHVTLQAIAGSGIDRRIRIVNDLLQVSLVDAGHLVVGGIVLMVSLIEIDLCQEGCCSGLGGTALLALCHGQYGIGILQVVDNLLPALVVGILRVRHVVIVVLCHVQFVDKRNLLEQALQLEVAIGTQELHLGSALLDGSIALVSLVQHVE